MVGFGLLVGHPGREISKLEVCRILVWSCSLPPPSAIMAVNKFPMKMGDVGEREQGWWQDAKEEGAVRKTEANFEPIEMVQTIMLYLRETRSLL